jgi:hypothetical protein
MHARRAWRQRRAGHHLLLSLLLLLLLVATLALLGAERFLSGKAMSATKSGQHCEEASVPGSITPQHVLQQGSVG